MAVIEPLLESRELKRVRLEGFMNFEDAVLRCGHRQYLCCTVTIPVFAILSASRGGSAAVHNIVGAPHVVLPKSYMPVDDG